MVAQQQRTHRQETQQQQGAVHLAQLRTHVRRVLRRVPKGVRSFLGAACLGVLALLLWRDALKTVDSPVFRAHFPQWVGGVLALGCLMIAPFLGGVARLLFGWVGPIDADADGTSGT